MRCLSAVIGCLCFALSAFGQITATSLRAKYGSPVKSDVPVSAETFRSKLADIVVKYASAETFKVRSGIEMIVNYGSDGQVCRIDFPQTELIGPQGFTDAEAQRRLHEVLDELVPSSIREKSCVRWRDRWGWCRRTGLNMRT